MNLTLRENVNWFNWEYMGSEKDANIMSDEELFKELEKYYDLNFN